MTESKVILLTGASRGIGQAIAKILLNEPGQHKLVVAARSAGPLDELKRLAPDRVCISVGDLSEPKCIKASVDLATSQFGRLDAVILNHGTLGEVKRIADSDAQGWVDTFQTNFFSCVNTVKLAIPELRKTKGRIIMTSSGAASNAYATWGAYGASKAAMNHLALTLKVEEPAITTVAIRPGMVDTEMQRAIREIHHNDMDETDRKKFLGVHAEGKLVKPEQAGGVIARLAVGAPEELSGQFLSWNDNSLEAFQG